MLKRGKEKMNKASRVQAPLQEREVTAYTPTTETLETLPRIETLPRANPAAMRAPRWKQVVVTIVPAYIGSTIFGLALFALFPGWPFPAINLFMNVFLVLLLTYVTQPLAQRLLAGWLYAPSKLSQKLAVRWRRIAARLPVSRFLVRRQAQRLIALARLTWAPGAYRATLQIRVTVHKGGYSCSRH
jgi:hypothetical protein